MRKQAYCLLCFADISSQQHVYDFIKCDSLLCGACKAQRKTLNHTYAFAGMRIRVLYEYNAFLENMIFQFKEGRDVALKDVFFYDFINEIHARFRQYTIVFMPSSEEKMKERGFLPVEEMLEKCKLAKIQPFYKAYDHKQSLQSYEQRAAISQVIKRKSNVKLPQTKLLLVDDVCTSGSTLTCAYNLLREHTYKVEALVVCAHPLFVESCDKKDLKRCRIFSILKNRKTC